MFNGPLMLAGQLGQFNTSSDLESHPPSPNPTPNPSHPLTLTCQGHMNGAHHATQAQSILSQRHKTAQQAHFYDLINSPNSEQRKFTHPPRKKKMAQEGPCSPSPLDLPQGSSLMSTSALSRSIPFSSGNPRIEETRGIIHLYPDETPSSDLQVKNPSFLSI